MEEASFLLPPICWVRILQFLIRETECESLQVSDLVSRNLKRVQITSGFEGFFICNQKGEIVFETKAFFLWIVFKFNVLHIAFKKVILLEIWKNNNIFFGKTTTTNPKAQDIIVQSIIQLLIEEENLAEEEKELSNPFRLVV